MTLVSKSREPFRAELRFTKDEIGAGVQVHLFVNGAELKPTTPGELSEASEGAVSALYRLREALRDAGTHNDEPTTD